MKITKDRLREIITEEIARTTQQIRNDLSGNFSAITPTTVARALVDLTHIVDSQSDQDFDDINAKIRQQAIGRPASEMNEDILKKIIAEELSHVISEQGWFTSTGPDTDRKLSTADASTLSQAGFDTSDIDEDSLTPAMMDALGRGTMPDEFVQGSGAAFIDSPHKGVRAVADQAEYGDDSAPEDLIAVAMAARAAELMDPDGESDNVEVKVKPRVFANKAKEINMNYVAGKAGDKNQNLKDIITRISVDYFDEDIQDVIDYVLAPRSTHDGGHPYDYPPGQEGRFVYK